MLIPRTSYIWGIVHISVELQQQNSLFNFACLTSCELTHLNCWFSPSPLHIHVHYLLCSNDIILGWQIEVEKTSHIWLQFISPSCSVHKSRRERDISPTTFCLLLLKWQMKQEKHSGLLCSRECFCHQCLNWDNRKYIFIWTLVLPSWCHYSVMSIGETNRIFHNLETLEGENPGYADSLYPSSEQSLCTLFHMWREFTHLPLPSSPTVPHTAAPFPTMVVTGTTKLYTEEFIQGKFTAKGSNNRYLPISQVKLITLTLIITTDTEYSCEPTWSPGGTCSGIGEGSNPVGCHFASKLPWPG